MGKRFNAQQESKSNGTNHHFGGYYGKFALIRFLYRSTISSWFTTFLILSEITEEITNLNSDTIITADSLGTAEHNRF